MARHVTDLDRQLDSILDDLGCYGGAAALKIVVSLLFVRSRILDVDLGDVRRRYRQWLRREFGPSAIGIASSRALPTSEVLEKLRCFCSTERVIQDTYYETMENDA